MNDLNKEREIIVKLGKSLAQTKDGHLPIERKESFTHSRFSTVTLGLRLHMDSKDVNHVLSLHLWVTKADGRMILRMGTEEDVRNYLMDIIADPKPVLSLLPDFYRSLLDN